MCKMKISVKYAENFLKFDLLLSNGFKIQNIPILACHVILSISMYGQIKNKKLELFEKLKISIN